MVNKRQSEGWIGWQGYRFISVNGKDMREHRHIMENHIGRKLNPEEHVHHINGDIIDNRIENLQILDIKEHGSLEGKKAKGIPKPNLRVEPTYNDCLFCSKKFEIKESQFTQKYCSRQCYWDSKKGKLLSKLHRNKISKGLYRYYENIEVV